MVSRGAAVRARWNARQRRCRAPQVKTKVTNMDLRDDYLIVHEPRSKVVMTVDFVQQRTVSFRKLFGIPSRVVEPVPASMATTSNGPGSPIFVKL